MRKPYIVYIEDGAEYILQKKFPNYIGRITNKLEGHIAQFPISGYNLYVSFVGNLNGNFIQIDKFAAEEAQSTMADMANYFIDNIDKQQYEKYKI
jgi:hypothetical protein